jgi:N-acetylneuraminic acid mutarotase
MQRYARTKVVLAILLISICLASAAQAAGTWTLTGTMGTGRYAVTAVLLPSGMVLVAGGINGATVVASAELYDPTTGTWSPTGSMKTARNNYTAVLLGNGKVLVAGGCTNSTCSAATSSAELYDPSTGTWSSTTSMSTLRYFFAATLLGSGKVLVEGGCSLVNCNASSATAELYDPSTGKWSLTGSMNSARDYHTATLLADGRVLVVGGYSGGIITEIYNPTTATWTTAASALVPHALHAATLLTNGKVLVAGGYIANLPSAYCEVYDPAINTWSVTGSMTSKRYNQGQLLLPGGKVIAVGGGTYIRPKFQKLATVELYDASTGTWAATGSMGTQRLQQGTALLINGQILAAGGLNNLNVSLATAELYTP